MKYGAMRMTREELYALPSMKLTPGVPRFVRGPMPRGFMPLMALGHAFHEVQCFADPWAPSDLTLFAMKWDASHVIIGHPCAWAAAGAFNLAAAHRPEGVP